MCFELQLYLSKKHTCYQIIQSYFFLFLDVAMEILRYCEHEHRQTGDVIMKQGEEGNK